jgi:hypothetical protein
MQKKYDQMLQLDPMKMTLDTFRNIRKWSCSCNSRIRISISAYNFCFFTDTSDLRAVGHAIETAQVHGTFKGFFISWGGVRLSPLVTLATNWPIVRAPDDR